MLDIEKDALVPHLSGHFSDEGSAHCSHTLTLRHDDLLGAYPPMSQANWARVESSVNLDASGNPDPYFVSIDLATAPHPQTLLVMHLSGQPLTVEHGAPLRLLVPVKLGLKNVNAVTRITYSAEEQEITGLSTVIPPTMESRYIVSRRQGNNAA